jgi:two-component system, NarL family, response regulator DevR
LMGEGVQTREIRVMHVEDHAGFRDLVKNLLDGQSDMEVVAQAGSLYEARARAAASEIDVAVLDLSLPDGNGLDLIPELRRANPHVGVLVLSANLDPAGSERAPGACADEILDKLAPVEAVLDSVRKLGIKN